MARTNFTVTSGFFWTKSRVVMMMPPGIGAYFEALQSSTGSPARRSSVDVSTVAKKPLTRPCFKSSTFPAFEPIA